MDMDQPLSPVNQLIQTEETPLLSPAGEPSKRFKKSPISAKEYLQAGRKDV